MLLDAHIHFSGDLPKFDIGFLCSVNLIQAKELISKKDELKERGFYLFIGVHPFWVNLGLDLGVIEGFLDNGAFGVGEIGLDRRRSNLKEQIELFKKQIELAKQRNYYINLHCVRAEKYVFELLKDYSKVIVHSFSGSLFYLERFIERGWFISFGPSVLKFAKYGQLLSACPLERLLIETDFPYQTKDVSILERILKKVSDVKSVEVEKVGDYVYRNFREIIKNSVVDGAGEFKKTC